MQAKLFNHGNYNMNKTQQTLLFVKNLSYFYPWTYRKQKHIRFLSNGATRGEFSDSDLLKIFGLE